jgi:hypothetical protein
MRLARAKIGERRQAELLGQGIRGADAHLQRTGHVGVAAPEDAFVEQAEQRVEDGRGTEEHLVEEGDLGFEAE